MVAQADGQLDPLIPQPRSREELIDDSIETLLADVRELTRGVRHLTGIGEQTAKGVASLLTNDELNAGELRALRGELGSVKDLLREVLGRLPEPKKRAPRKSMRVRKTS